MHNNRQKWVSNALTQVLNGQDRHWKDLYMSSKKHLEKLLEKARMSDEWSVEMPKNIKRHQFLLKAKNLLEHLKSGGKFGIIFFKPKVVSEAKDIVKKTYIDGNLCNNIESLKKL